MTDTPRDLIIEQATPETVDEAAALFATGFADDEVVRALSPGGRNRRQRLTDLYRTMHTVNTLNTGVIDLVRERPGGPLLGAAAWDGPRRKRSFADAARALWRTLTTFYPWELVRVARNARVLAKKHPDVRHWYLESIVVDPEGRGKGIGSLLLKHRLKVIDSVHLPAYLEASSERSRDLYTRHGFETTEPVELHGDATAWAMVRPAAARGKRRAA